MSIDSVDKLFAYMSSSEPRKAFPVLLESLRGGDSNLRAASVEGLGQLTQGGIAAGEVVPHMIRALLDDGPVVGSAAAEALGDLGASAVDAVQALITALRLGEGNVRFEAAVALGKIGPGAWNAVPELVTAFTKEGGPQYQAAVALGRIQAMANIAVPALLEGLKSRDRELRSAVVEAILSFGLNARCFLLRALRHPHPGVRAGATYLFNKIPPSRS